MISAFKRLVNSNGDGKQTTTAVAGDAVTGNQIPSQKTGPQPSSNPTSLLNNGMHMISQSLQKKFSRGVNYNSKLCQEVRKNVICYTRPVVGWCILGININEKLKK